MPTSIYKEGEMDLAQAATIANSVRNPLAAIRAQIELVRDQTDPLDPRHESIDIALEEIERISNSIEAVLDRSEVPTLQTRDCDLATILANATTTLLAKAERHGVTVRREGLDREIRIQTDGNRIGKAVRRILENAIEASAPGGEVQFFCDCTAAAIEITIVDQGCGIAAEDIRSLGEAFFTKKSKGLGLGLYLAKRDLDLIGAKFSLKSTPQRGTTAVIQISKRKEKA